MQTSIFRRTLCLIVSLLVVSGTLQAQPYVTVTDDGYEFSPDPVYIVAGMGVLWVDDGSGPYTIYGVWGSFDTPGGYYFPDPGTYSYYDDVGDLGTFYVSTNTPPSVTITNPLNNAVLTAPATFIFGADASDTDPDGLSDVEFYVGTNLVDDVFDSPFTTTISNLAVGKYVLTAIAYDNMWPDTNSITTATNSITITVAPRLTTPSVVAGQFRFSAAGLAIGKTNVLQFTTNMLSSPNWTSIATNVASTNWMSFTNPVSAGRRFFRLFQLP